VPPPVLQPKEKPGVYFKARGSAVALAKLRLTLPNDSATGPPALPRAIAGLHDPSCWPGTRDGEVYNLYGSHCQAKCIGYALMPVLRALLFGMLRFGGRCA